MPVLTATNIRHSYGQRMILDGVSMSIEPSQRVGIVGRNGCGKSTLLRILDGEVKPDFGDVALNKGARAGHMLQDPVFEDGATLHSAAEEAFKELHRLHKELDGVFARMADAQGDALDKLLRQQERLEGQIEAAGGYAVDHRIAEVLHGLGFTDAQFTVPVAGLSGGQKSRLALAQCLLESPDVLLLDEPTNHLDIDGRLWLERFLIDEFKGAVVLISHDRYLLDNVVTRIVEVENGRLIDYPGNYEAFREIRAQRRLSMLRAYENQQTQFKKEEAYIRRYKAGQRAKQARGRATKLERAKESSQLERPMEVESFRLNLPKAERTGDIVVSARGVSKRYPADDGTEKVLFDGLDLLVGRGERWGIIGPNGAGKSTLVRVLLKEQEPDAGKVTLGSNVKVGYYRQGHEGLDPERRVYQHLQDVIMKECPGTSFSEQQARDLAGAFLFSGAEQDKPLGVLSGGERARVLLAALLASAKNVLVMDEPTNHLDIPSAERLEDALDPGDEEEPGNFQGTLVLISHDRALIDACCDHLLILDGKGNAEAFVGSYSEWHEREVARKRQADAEAAADKGRRDAAEKSRRAAEESRKAAAKPAPQPGNPLARVSTEKLEQRIAQIEKRITEIDGLMQQPEVWKDSARCAKLGDERSRLAGELEPLEYEYFSRGQ
jgi:ATP-binding cassette, subfamily F, member 3